MFQDGLLDQTLPISYLHMRIMLDGEDVPEVSDDDDEGDREVQTRFVPGETVTYLYK